MNKINALILFLLLVSSHIECFSQEMNSFEVDTYSEPTESKLVKAKVKSLTEKIYSAVSKFGKPEKEKLLHKTSIYYNSNGTIKQKVLNDSNVGLVTYQFIRNNSGVLIEKNVYGLNKKLWKKYLFKNDSLGRIIEEIKYSSDGSFVHKVSYDYDHKNNLTKQSFFDYDGEYTDRIIEYEYNEVGKKIKEIHHNNLVYDFSYKENGDLSEVKRNSEIIKTYKYDKQGNEIEHVDMEGGFNHKFTDVYTFDSVGNWIMKTSYDFRKVHSITERQIEYVK